MLSVLCVVEKTNTAIDRLAKGVEPYHSNLNYNIVDVHPKRPDQQQLSRFEELAKTADIIDYQYFRTAELVRKLYPWVKDIPSILTHNNPYSITESDWNSYQVIVGNNLSITKNLKDITKSRVEYIPLVSEPHFWTYNDDYKYPRTVIMVANRIEAKKGILPVAQACKKINAKMYLVGAISDPDYWRQIMALGNVEFAQEVSNEELRNLYYKSGIHVCNSVDNFESGTLPILEAIFCGVPVATRNIGHVPDFKTKDNLYIMHCEPEDVDYIAKAINELFADKKRIDTQRQEAWFSIKERNYEWRAYLYQKLYREIMGGQTVSVIVPVADKPDVTNRTIDSILNQTHKNIEIIVVDDGQTKQGDTIANLQKISSIPFRYIAIEEGGYNLAKARNIGSIEATGDVLVFCDQRMIMQNDCIEQFLKELKPRYWLYGNKGAKKDFVENLSCIYRDDFVTFGMFNERINKYGGMSQECRSRARRQGLITHFVENAKAEPNGKSSNRRNKRLEIMAMKNLLRKIGLS